MEGQERANIEARVKVLRNVHALLDSAIVQLNQYSHIITTLNLLSKAPEPGSKQPECAEKDAAAETDGMNDLLNEEVESLAETTDETGSSSELRRRRLEKFSQSPETSDGSQNVDS